MRPLLPPRGLFVPTSILFGDLPDTVRMTWMQLRALAWGQQETPPVSIGQLHQITGKSQSTLYGHMATLRDRDALRWRPAQGGTLIVTFPAETDVNSENLELPYQEEVNISSTTPIDSEIDLLNRAAKFRKSGKPFRKSGIDLPQDLVDYLTDLGVYPQALARVSESGWTVDQLWHLALTVAEDRTAKAPGGLFLSRLATTPPPQGEPCPVCGLIGAHAANCYQRYAVAGVTC